MYIALNQPEFPAMTAKITLKPIEEPMKITTHYKKESIWSSGVCKFLLIYWVLIMAVALIAH